MNNRKVYISVIPFKHKMSRLKQGIIAVGFMALIGLQSGCSLFTKDVPYQTSKRNIPTKTQKPQRSGPDAITTMEFLGIDYNEVEVLPDGYYTSSFLSTDIYLAVAVRNGSATVKETPDGYTISEGSITIDQSGDIAAVCREADTDGNKIIDENEADNLMERVYANNLK